MKISIKEYIQSKWKKYVCCMENYGESYLKMYKNRELYNLRKIESEHPVEK
jgi:hypothetical protein